MKEFVKSKNGVIIILIILLMSGCGVGSYSYWDLHNTVKKDKQTYENTIAALRTDSVFQSTNQHGDTVYSTTAATMEPADILKSEMYKALDAKTQRYVKELAKTKNLLASSTATIQAKDSMLAAVTYDSTSTIVTDSTVAFYKGTMVSFSNMDSIGTDSSAIDSAAHIKAAMVNYFQAQDTSSILKYEVNLTFGDSFIFAMKYIYAPEIRTDYTRNKDGSVKVEYQIDDPNATIVAAQAFYIPRKEYKTKFGEKFDKFFSGTAVGRTLKTITFVAIPVAAFGVGVYVGIEASK